MGDCKVFKVKGGGLPVVGDGGSLMTLRAGSVTTLSIAFQICDGF